MYYYKTELHGTKISKKASKYMDSVNERLFIVKDHLENEIIQLNDVVMCLQIIESGFDQEAGDKQKQETAFVRTLTRLLQILLGDLHRDYNLISELMDNN